MGFFDDALKGAVPGGDLTKPIAIAAGALLLGRMLGGGQAAAPPRPADPAAPPTAGGGGLLDGLSDSHEQARSLRPDGACQFLGGERSQHAHSARPTRERARPADGQPTRGEGWDERTGIARSARAGPAWAGEQSHAERACSHSGGARRARPVTPADEHGSGSHPLGRPARPCAGHPRRAAAALLESFAPEAPRGWPGQARPRR